ncbi:helix-turn-helix domain-containing protein [Puteibacter caeruleilacunae]|nr:helix-turn-helix domain-containing protein [Puteibacter caeruleilacunae]
MKHTNKIKTYCSKIIESHCFAKSVVNKELLRYLVDNTLAGNTPTELQIAYDVFGKNPDPDKDHNVRIYILNLRKKLQAYYEKEGLNDEIKFEIPKGSYQVTFHYNQLELFKSSLYRKAPVILIVSLILCISGVILSLNSSSPPAAKQFLWKELYKHKHPVLIVVGDHYFFRLKSPLGGLALSRHTNINSLDDLNERMDENPTSKEDIVITTQTFIDRQSNFGLYKIASSLGGGFLNMKMKYASEVTWEDVKGHHVIFVGSYKALRIFKPVMKKIGISFELENYTTHYTTNDSIIDLKTESDGYLTADYTTISRFVTSDDRSVITFLSNREIGNIATLKFIFDAANLEDLEEKVDELSTDNFKSIIKIIGKETTDFKIDILRVDPINTDVDKFWP